MFQATYLGHAGLFVETDYGNVLCDPWHGDNLKFFGTWKVYPDNRHLPWDDIIARTDVLYVSHVHEDHFDAELLARVRKDVVVVCPPFRFPVLRDKLRGLGFTNVVVTNKFIRHNPIRPKHADDFSEAAYRDGIVGALKLQVFVAETPNREMEDSSVMIYADGTKLFNLNDSFLDDRQIDEIRLTYGDVDLFCGQFTGASWYPMAYDYPPDVMRAKCREHADKNRARFLAVAGMLGARQIIPTSGPPLLIGPVADRNYFVDESPSALVDAWQAPWPVPVQRKWPGDRFVASKPYDRPNPPPPSKATLVNEAPRYTLPGVVKETDYQRARYTFMVRMNRLLSANRWLGDVIPQLLVLNVGELCSFVFDWKEGIVSANPSGYLPHGEPWQRIWMPAQLFAMLVLTDDDDWEKAFISGRCRFSRDPDRYSEWLITVFRNMDQDRLAAIGQLASAGRPAGDTVIIGGHECQRSCPHMGLPLDRYGVIDQNTGTIACRGHGWRWRLDGSPVNNHHRLAVRPCESSGPAAAGTPPPPATGGG